MKDEERHSGQVPERRIKTNERGRVLRSLCRRKIDTAVNLRDKSFTNFDHGKSLVSDKKLKLKMRDLKTNGGINERVSVDGGDDNIKDKRIIVLFFD